MVEFSEFYFKIPFLTRYWLTITVGLSVLARVEVLDGHKLPLLWDHFFENGEFWRPLSAVFYVPPEHFYFLICNYVLYQFSEQLEFQKFAGRAEDYFMVLVFNWLCGVAWSYYFKFPLLMSTMVMSVVTLWCQYNTHRVLSLPNWDIWHAVPWHWPYELRNIQFKAPYLPWAILIVNIMYDRHFYYYWGGWGRYGQTLTPQGTEEFAGILVGYVAYYLLEIYPQDHGWSPLKAPDFLRELFGKAPRPTASSYANSNQSAFDRRWGRGYTTGGRCASEATANDGYGHKID